MTRAGIVRARRAQARRWGYGPDLAIVVRKRICGCTVLRTGDPERAEKLVRAGAHREYRVLRMSPAEALEAEAQTCGRCPDRPTPNKETR